MDITKSLYQACNPNKTLNSNNPEDKKRYIDFSPVRGREIIKELKRTITRLSPDLPTCQLFTGHIGVGKSTELMRLKSELETEFFHVVYFESSQTLDLGDVDVTDILLAIAKEVSHSLEVTQIKVKSGFFQTLFKDVIEFLQTPLDIDFEAELSVGIAKITAKTKESPKLRNQLRQYLEPRTASILQSINRELLIPAQEELKKRGKSGLVVIIDNLDRIDNSPKANGQYQPEYLFVERGEDLKALSCHIVYTIPLVLIFSNALGRLINRFGVDPKVLPMISVKQRNGEYYSAAMTLLQQMIMVRAFPGVNWQQSSEKLALTTQIFDSPKTFDRLCQVSGGHLRSLLKLLFRCLQSQDVPISRLCLENTIREQCNLLSLAITPDEWELLREVRKTKTYRGEEQYDILLRSLFVFEYRDDQGSWFDINPILLENSEFSGYYRDSYHE
ncbi:KAP family P-loop domain-containing protein [Cylindrospermopsis raciborskii CENA303]|uniref:KAP family P-loop domain-containing protein n=1 Tax=Cylindrospermopsis raciborskii CENA303 TaxID=1170769 RepID=A0A1X4G772_9CYAN|nr:P-loop NTPase fold protein [Cylindrospermopsis raciborskii]OSO90859.1 KAP family P-loop domain-containing protein [Cylindrospermopsis raciborskii CENA303]